MNNSAGPGSNGVGIRHPYPNGLREAGFTVAVASADQVLGACVRRWVERSEDFSWAGQAAEFRGTLRLVARVHPDLLIVDCSLPGGGSRALIRSLVPEQGPLLILCSRDRRDAILAFEIHAVHFLEKPVVEARLSAAMSSALQRLV